MKRILLIIALALTLPSIPAWSQQIITGEGPDAITTEWIDGNEWAVLSADSIIVMFNAREVHNFGHYYRIGLSVTNMSSRPVLYDPDSVTARLTNVRSEVVPLQVLTAEQFRKKVNKDQFWTAVVNDAIAVLFSEEYESWAPGYTALSMYGTRQDQKMERHMVQAGYLKKNTIRPGETLTGFFNVKHHKDGSSLELDLPIGGCTFKGAWWVYKD